MSLGPLIPWMLAGFFSIALIVVLLSLLVRSRRRSPEARLARLLERRQITEAAELMVELERHDDAVELLIRARRQADAARIFMHTRDYERAAELFESVNDFEGAVEAHERAGKLLEAGRLMERLCRFERAGDLLAEAGHLKEAIRVYRRGNQHRKVGELLIRLGDRKGAARLFAMHHAEQGELETAVELYVEAGDVRKAVELYRSRQDWAGLSGLMRRLGHHDMAEKFARRATAQQPQSTPEAPTAPAVLPAIPLAELPVVEAAASPPPRITRQMDRQIRSAETAVEPPDLSRARKNLEAIIAENPEDLRALFGYSEVLRRSGALEEAVGALAGAADRFRSRGAPMKAVATLRRLLDVAPYRRDLHEDLATLYTEMGVKNEAISQTRHLINWLLEESRALDALHAVGRILDLSPEVLVDRLLLAEAYAQHLALDAAGRRYREVLDLLDREEDSDARWIHVARRYLHHDPDDLPVMQGLAERLARSDAYAEALPWLQRCVSQEPADPSSLETLATCFEGLGQPNKAAAVLSILAELYGQRGLVQARDAVIARLDAWRPAAPVDTAADPSAPGRGDLFELDWDLPTPVTTPAR